MHRVASTQPRPFLKWAGGKRQMLPQLRRFYPERVSHYFEPFLGSGAVFFDLWNQGTLASARVTLSDGNSDLIGCYLRVRDAVDEVIGALEALAQGHARGGADHYYEVRDQRFNPQRAAWRRTGADVQTYGPDLAAMLMYLNRTGYNGLFRLNARGDYNVPAGRYDRPRVVDADRLRAVSCVLAQPQVTISLAPFEDVGRAARAGDLVYFDPPYAPLSRTAQFRSYTAEGFGDDDQARLQRLAQSLSRRRVLVMLSNSTAGSVSALYEQGGTTPRAGLRAFRLAARRAINSVAAGRGSIEELLVTNLEQRALCR
jgi:DNA adenine methylase